ncbi:hypothetical protein VW29_02780 [Devosia limi DSM 17137]|uniref:Sap, sulfolipid-1-addressing protein n=1 Tax=Devosia limi DSM 17137 TaxID=1121477 RepID=A0A0F5LVY0_9HYPH|nr:GAP family protein [Devosia limi]KKB86493.1 hypothetical protein VW29_02780 [Devosia limi DSM 17137]SHE86716.1 Sap, sulfolipid-1-addressing protein [Devosia limi DSM 17137]
MLLDVIGQMLPMAMAIALGPIPIVAAVLVALSGSGRGAGFAFTLGWIAGMTVLAIVLVVLIGQLGEPRPGGNFWLDLTRVLVGLLLLWAALRKWQKRPRGGDKPVVPKWIDTFSDVDGAKALRLGVTVALVNPKHFAFTLAAMSPLAEVSLSIAAIGVDVLVFVLLSSGSVLAVALVHAFGGQGVTAQLEGVKQFMLANNNVILMVIFAILGMSVLGSGLSGLAAS